MERQVILTFDGVCISYGPKSVVENLSFTLRQGEVLAIIGESGSGKTSLLKAILGLLEPEGNVTQGRIFYKDIPLLRISSPERRHLLGKEIGCIFQDTADTLCPIRKIGTQIYETVKLYQKCKKNDVKEKALALMKKIGLEDPLRIWESYPFELSGGMSQRVGIIMTLLLQPTLLLADEPTSALDVLVQQDVLQQMKELKEAGQTMILVTHQMEVAEQLADYVLVMKKGEVVEQGLLKEVFAHPKESYSQKLLDAVLRLE